MENSLENRKPQRLQKYAGTIYLCLSFLIHILWSRFDTCRVMSIVSRKFTEFYWTLTDVDIIEAVTLFYQVGILHEKHGR